MRMRCLVSIVIPVCNVAPWLRACLDSVLAQSYGDWEAICVDDGSTDESGAILDEYATRDARFVVLHQANHGRGGARNAALNLARGAWLCFLDADDLFAPKMLACGVQLIRDNPDCDIVRTRMATFVDGTDMRQSTVWSADLLHGSCWTGFYRRDKFNDVRFTDFLVGEDRVYAATCVFRTNRIAECKTVGYLYRQRATSVSHMAMSPQKAKDGFLHVAEMLKIANANARTLERPFRRQLVSQVLEEAASNCRQLPRTERRAVERCWRACLADLRRRRLLTPWGRFVSHVVCVLPFGAVTFVLCVLPYFLKKGGMHR